jgi:extracellular elastinolytic metalloproteinase
MPAHSKLSIITRNNIPIIKDSGENSGATTTGDLVSISVDPQTVVTLFGVATASWPQKVKVELLDKDLKPIGSTRFLDGVNRESLLVQDATTPEKTITLDPSGAKTTVEATFYHKKNDEEGWKVSTIKKDKIKEFTDDALESAISLVPVDDGGHGVQDYQNTTLNISRMTLF